MAYNFDTFDTKILETKNWLVSEFRALRTGRATPAILDGVRVDNYGSMSPISHVANISIEDARTLFISPWDKGSVKAIETAIAKSNTGLSVAAVGDGLRASFPELTGDVAVARDGLGVERSTSPEVSTRDAFDFGRRRQVDGRLCAFLGFFKKHLRQVKEPVEEK